MGYIRSIKISDSVQNYKFNQNEDVISGISKINIFVGSNNSGKSRLMRSIYRDDDLKLNIGDPKLIEYNELIQDLNQDVSSVYGNNTIHIEGINKEDYMSPIGYIPEESALDHDFSIKMEELDKAIEKTYTCNGLSEEGQKLLRKMICNKFKGISKKYLYKYNNGEFQEILKGKSFKRIYIPVLRGLRRLTSDSDVLLERTNKDYFITHNPSGNMEVFTGQDLYNDVLDLLCGGFNDRNHIREFEEFLSENFFNRQPISLIPRRGSDVLYVKIGEEKEQPIYNLGDGIQSIIILTFKLFANKGKDVLFFIEEPELYLHPGLQRKLIEIFSRDEFNQYQYFMTSHSNHLLDLTLDSNDISIYKFSKVVGSGNGGEEDAQFNIENVNNDDMSVLETLGVNNSSIFLANCTIWVEGITDRLYIRKYLEIYQQEKFKNGEKIYVEDIHYAFLEYSGGNITHWDFLDESSGDEGPMNHSSICNNIFLIADNDGYTLEDKSDTEKAKRLIKLREYFSENFYCLPVKEIENILTPSVIKKVVNQFTDKRVGPDIDKDATFLGQATFTIEEYRQENLGAFIEQKIDEQAAKQVAEQKAADEKPYTYERKKNFAKGNTINRKVPFCKYALQEMQSINDMSGEAIDLCEKIYNFIASHN